MQALEARILDRLLDPIGRAMTPEVAQVLVRYEWMIRLKPSSI